MVADQDQITSAVITATDEHGEPFDVDGLVIPVIIPADEVVALLTDYDPDYASSPPAADSRVIARVVLDALKRHVEGP